MRPRLSITVLSGQYSNEGALHNILCLARMAREELAQRASFALPAEAVDRLRAAAGTIILSSPEFQRRLNDVGARVVAVPFPSGSAAVGVP